VSGWPDYYRYTVRRSSPQTVSGAGTGLGVDTNQSYHGQYCLRMAVQA